LIEGDKFVDPNRYLSWPTSWRNEKRKWKRCLLKKKTSGVATNVYLRKTLEKLKRGLWILKIRVQELFTHREDISTPCAHHKRQQPLIECVQRDFKIIYLPKSGELHLLYYFITFYFFSSPQGCCPCSYISPDVMRKSDLRSSLILNVCVLN